MAKGTEMYGIRIPQESDLPARLKINARKAGITIYGLIDNLLNSYERQQGDNLTQPQRDSLEERFLSFENRLQAIEGQLRNLSGQEPDGQAEESKSAKEAVEKQTADKIHKMVEEGKMTLRQIAEKFNAVNEGGSSDWDKNALSKLRLKYYPRDKGDEAGADMKVEGVE
jgi:hypothetical protein